MVHGSLVHGSLVHEWLIFGSVFCGVLTLRLSQRCSTFAVPIMQCEKKAVYEIP